mgnify:CR=1 FL=1
MLCGYLILKINRLNHREENLLPICLWFYNPITVVISSRGSAESIMSFLVLAFVYYFKLKRSFTSGIFYGLAIHFKIYPLAYGLLILAYYLSRTLENKKKLNAVDLAAAVFDWELLKFGAGAFIALALPTAYYYVT